MDYRVFVSPTTHWDREWVQPVEQFRIRLVHLVDRLIRILESDTRYACFVFDGQMVPLEDYLEIKPVNRPTLERLAQEGRLIVGPWYVLADQFLEDGESTVRNLMIGCRMAREMGAEPMQVCYVPDSFGSIETLPMLARGCGLPYVMFGRGRPEGIAEGKREFVWRAPDGSEVLAINHGYAGGLFLSYPQIWTDIRRARPTGPEAAETFHSKLPDLAENETTPNLYLSVGVDHMEPRESLPDIVAYLNEHVEGCEFDIASPEDFARAVEADAAELPAYTGEMRGENVRQFNGVTSSRIRLKQTNFRCQRWLERYVEPLSTMAMLGADYDYPAELLDRLWRTLIANHPHDSICGCSLDRVHEDMANRYARIEDASEKLTEHATRALTPRIDTRGPAEAAAAIAVFNTLGGARDGVVRGWVRVPQRLRGEAFHLVDAAGEPVPARIRVQARKRMDLESLPMTTRQLGTVLSKDAEPERPDDDVFTVLDIECVAPDLPAMGHRTFWLAPGEGPDCEARVRATEEGMENEFLRVAFNANGTFDLTDLRTERTFGDLHRFEDTEDIGDAYGHRHYDSPDTRTTLNAKAELTLVEELPFRVTWRVEVPWSLPASSGPGGRSDQTEDARIVSDVTLYAGLDRVEIRTRLENRCRNHRLRAVFDTGLPVETSAAEGNFGVTERPVPSPEDSMEGYPQQSFVDVSDDRSGLCVMNRGLPEFEAVRRGDATRLYLTLLRCVGELGPPAGANHPVPGAQSQGRHTFEYAVRPHAGDWQEGGCLAAAHDYTVPPVADGTDLHPGPLPAACPLVEPDPRLVLTALKKAEEDDDVIVRLWNPTGADVTLRLRGTLKQSDARLTDLNETPVGPCPLADGAPCPTVPARGLTTLRLTP
ncbi:MAG: glycoside hydrolase family 38 C-terminal domain-containing protein [Candidatus Brocadiia bacterium]